MAKWLRHGNTRCMQQWSTCQTADCHILLYDILMHSRAALRLAMSILRSGVHKYITSLSVVQIYIGVIVISEVVVLLGGFVTFVTMVMFTVYHLRKQSVLLTSNRFPIVYAVNNRSLFTKKRSCSLHTCIECLTFTS